MARPEKIAEVQAITDRLQSAQCIVMADYTGLTVASDDGRSGRSAASRTSSAGSSRTGWRCARGRGRAGVPQGLPQGPHGPRVRSREPGRLPRRSSRSSPRTTRSCRSRAAWSTASTWTRSGHRPVEDPEQGRVDRQDDGQHQLARQRPRRHRQWCRRRTVPGHRRRGQAEGRGRLRPSRSASIDGTAQNENARRPSPDDQGERPMSEDIKLSDNAQKVLELIESMTILEAADLVKAMEEKFGVSAAAPVAVAAAPGRRRRGRRPRTSSPSCSPASATRRSRSSRRSAPSPPWA